MATLSVTAVEDGWRLEGAWSGTGPVNVFLGHLRARAFAPATMRAYAYDLLNFGRFCLDHDLGLDEAVAADIFAWIDWQTTPPSSKGTVVRLGRRGAAPSTINRRVAAVRALFEHQVMLGDREVNPVPAPRRGLGLRPKARGMLGHLGPGRARPGGRLVREPRRHLATLGLSDRALRDRLRVARAFLRAHPDLQRWMDQPLQGRLTDLSRSGAWPLVGWAILAGRARVDLDLLMARDLGHLSRVAATVHADDDARLRTTAARLGWAPRWTDTVLRGCLTLIVAWTGTAPSRLTVDDLERFRAAVSDSPVVSRSSRKAYLARLHSLQQLLFEARIVDTPPTRGPAAATVDQRLQVIPADELRRTVTRYVTTRAAVLAPKSVESLINDLIPFATFITGTFPEVTAVRQLRREHIEEFLVWNRTARTWRGRKASTRKVSPSVIHATVLTVRNFLDDITLWGWADRPTRRLLFPTDIPKLPRALPRALPPDIDAAVQAAIMQLDDLPARTVLVLLRRAGLRIGEALDLPLDAVVDYGPAGTWLRVPLGKMATERSVPLDADTVSLLDTWADQRGAQRALPHPRGGAPTDFLFVQRGRRLGSVRVRNRLTTAVAGTGLTGPDGAPLTITPHQLRHTYATELANAGMSLQALMALLGHVTPEMTLRYATLASPTIRAAYDTAISASRRRLPIVVAGRPAPPDRVEWLHSEMLKTRLATGYCALPSEAGACPYANICEHCENFQPAPQATPTLRAQLADIRRLQTDAQQRGWTSETRRHADTVQRLERHLERLAPRPGS